jgi:uncharacterized peroxidase-related enzyme
MPFLKSPPARNFPEAMKRNPAIAEPLYGLNEAIMRGPSSFTAGERELIAAYVSALNGCNYCRTEHASVAEAFGMREGLVGELVENFDAADVADGLRAALAYAGKMTTDPEGLGEDDVAAFMAAGHDEKALYDVVMVTAVFLMSNSIIHGFGIPEQGPERLAMATKRLHDMGYSYGSAGKGSTMAAVRRRH